MERILEQLYNGDLSPADSRNYDNPQYPGMCQVVLEETEEFAAALKAERREEFDAMMDHYLELCYVEKTQAFSDGFRIGARIMCEVFAGGRDQTCCRQ